MQLPSYRWRLAHLAALWAYGVGQPVFSMLKGNPEFLVVRGSTRADVMVFALLIAVFPPLMVVVVEALASVVSDALSRALHIVAIWSFAFLAGVQFLRLLDPERGAALLLPMIPAALAALAYMRWNTFRTFLSISLALPVIGLIGFVVTIPLAVDDAAGADVDVATNTPVVLVVFDEFPVSSLLEADGTLDEVRYPNFAQLARDGTWYQRATTVHWATAQAVPAILTGRNPRPGELPTLSDHPENLFTALGERYTVHAQEQLTLLCPSRYCPRKRDDVAFVDRQRGLMYDVAIGFFHRVLPASIRGNLPPIGERWGGFGEDSDEPVRERVLGALGWEAWLNVAAHARNRQKAEFAGFLRSLQPEHGRRSLHFVHLALPHSPFRFLPSGREYRGVVTEEGMRADWTRWLSSKWLVDQALQGHLLQVGYTDRLVGLLLKRLKAAGLYDRALIVVAADHGVSFRPGRPSRAGTEETIADVAGVPLFVKYPQQREGRVDRRDAKTIDILPTVADVIGVRLPWPVDGRSLLARPIVRPVSVVGPDDVTITATPDAVAEGVRATARRNARLFGEGSQSMYRIGPHRELLDRSVTSVAPIREQGAKVWFEDATEFENVRLASLFVPARIVGRVEHGSLAPGSPIAVAVNGRIAATTRVFESRGRIRFAVLVPEMVFREGRNAVDVYAVEVQVAGVRLARLGGAAPDKRRVASYDRTTTGTLRDGAASKG